MVDSPKGELFQEVDKMVVVGGLKNREFLPQNTAKMHPNMIRFCHQIKNNKNCLERRFSRLTP